MSWFGLGGGKKDDAGGAGQASTYDFAAGNATAFSEDPGGAAFDGGANLVGGGSLGGGMGQLEELVLAEQQTALVRQVIGRLTEMAFDSCIAKPSSALSSSEQSCIQATVAKYLDTSEFVLGRVQRQARAGKM